METEKYQHLLPVDLLFFSHFIFFPKFLFYSNLIYYCSYFPTFSCVLPCFLFFGSFRLVFAYIYMFPLYIKSLELQYSLTPDV